MALQPIHHPMGTCIRPLVLIACVLITLGLAACTGERRGEPYLVSDTTAMAGDTLNVLQNLTVVDVLQSDQRFNAFAMALDSAGIAARLEEQGPFTVFVPTNDAFQGTRQSLSGPESRNRLSSILLYHVVGQNLTADALRRRDSLRVQTLEGSHLTIVRRSGRFMVNGVPLARTSVTVGNGTVFVLRAALNPPLEAAAPTPASAQNRTPAGQ